jgi:hypothetical protein
VWWAISWRQIHSCRSSSGRLHSWPKALRLGTTIISSSGWGRGMGRSYWPKLRRARWPTIEPAVMATIVGCMAWSMGPTMAATWSSGGRSSGSLGRSGSSGASSPGRLPSEAARRSSRGRKASRVLLAHRARLTGTTVRPRPPTDVDRPVTLPTCSSATRASCSSLIRSSGSTLGSLWPSVATAWARLRAASQGI